MAMSRAVVERPTPARASSAALRTPWWLASQRWTAGVSVVMSTPEGNRARWTTVRVGCAVNLGVLNAARTRSQHSHGVQHSDEERAGGYGRGQ